MAGRKRAEAGAVLGFLDLCQSPRCPPMAGGMCEWPACAAENLAEMKARQSAGTGERLIPAIPTTQTLPEGNPS